MDAEETELHRLARILYEKMDALDPDDEQVKWDDLNDWRKEFYIACVEAVLTAAQQPQ